MNSCLLCCPKTYSFCTNCLKVVEVEYGIKNEKRENECVECENDIKIEKIACQICDSEFSNYSCHEEGRYCQECKSRGFRFLCKCFYFYFFFEINF